ncbi:MAG: hypothetical protein HKN24_01430 [Acidimicrobiales bacterium]|nr:hypothetical protein [Acidimicrobiales bacterium]
MKTFDFEFTVPASQQRVRDFHHDTAVLRILTPPPTIMQVHSMEPLAEGSISRFTIWAGPIPLRWEATHRDVSDLGFTDVQTNGPMKHWEHTHRFTEAGPDQTMVTEHIEYEHGGGLWGAVTRAFFSAPALRALFAYRKFQTRRHCR